MENFFEHLERHFGVHQLDFIQRPVEKRDTRFIIASFEFLIACFQGFYVRIRWWLGTFFVARRRRFCYWKPLRSRRRGLLSSRLFIFFETTFFVLLSAATMAGIVSSYIH